MSEPGNELAELLWENGPAFRRTAPHFPAAPFPPFTCSAAGTSKARELIKHPASAVMRDLDLPVHDDAVPWLHYPIIDGDDGGDADTAPLPPDYCALPSGYSYLPAAAVAAPAAVASRDAREPSSSHGAVVPITTRGAPPPEPAPKQPRPSGGEGVMNFSFFSRPLQRPQGTERASAAATASNPVDSTVVQTTTNRLRNTPLFSEQRMAWLQPPTVAAAPPAPLVPCRQGETAATVTQRLQSEATAPEPPPAAAATSSVCSGNGDRSQLKRSSHQSAEWSLSQDEDLDDEPGALRRSAARGTKRIRTAEVHNLSERRRRDRINERIRALQELIPNCNKIDKASMLEEAIEYLKTLQLQVQMMSMGTGLCVPPMLLPAAAMQHLQMPPMAHFPHLGAMGLGFGMGAFDMVPLPRVAGVQFPCPMILGAPMAMPPGSAAVPMFGVPGQAMPSPAPFPLAPGHMANNAAQAEQMPSDPAAQACIMHHA